MRYVEFAQQPNERNGCMLPVTALPELFNRPDAGYCSLYQFSQADAWAIRAQKDSKGLGRFSVYSDRLWIDIDRDNLEEAKVYAREVAALFKQQDYAFTVWVSGGKGFHICVRIVPMEGQAVPYSQAQWLEGQQIRCDFSLYQHGRLFSNPGRLHPKTGIKKHKIMEHAGSQILSIPLLPAPERAVMDTGTLSGPDLARIALSRVQGMIQDSQLIREGDRHQKYWSLAMGMFESGMSRDLILSMLCYVDQFLPVPKGREGVERAVEQAAQQSGG